ncbi:MAG: 50S ribosomal protein L4 [Planctomycetota bacterium]
MELDEQFLGGEVRPSLLKQAYVMYHANRRSGSASNRSRGMVEGSTRKLYRQKGTGNARAGSARTNIRVGGGVAFAKKPKSWRQSMPAKMRRLATRNALLAKIVDGELKVVEKFGFEAPKTKQFASILENLGIDRTCLVALDGDDRNSALSARNLPNVETITAAQLNTYDLLSKRYCLIEKDVLLAWVESQKPSAKGVEEAA